MLPHRIRLRGPWTVTPTAGGSSRVVKLPAQWDLVTGERSGVRLTRHFGWPAALQPHERVWIIINGVTAPCTIRLNDQTLGPVDGTFAEWEMTGLLQERNDLSITLSAAPRGAVWDEVAVEVRGQAWLDSLAVERRDSHLVLSGQVRGQANNRLDLYAILDRRTIAQASVAAGSAFRLESEPLSSPGGELRIELMDAAAVWHVAELPLPKG